jgi:hypothetical protein
MLAHNFLAGGGWEGFKNGMTTFFQDGLGGAGAQGLGIAVMIIGIVVAVISFVVHKFNPQSRMPSWIVCLVIGVAGSVLTSGMSRPIAMFNMIRDWIYSLIGI